MPPPLDPRLLDELRAFSTPTVCNAIETFDVRQRNEGFMDSSIVCRFPEMPPVVGYASTLKICAAEPGDDALPFDRISDAIVQVPAPRIVVVQDLDEHPVGSYWGEVNASVYAALGAIAAVTNGGVRDLPEVRATGFQFFSSCVLVSHAYVRVVEAGSPVTVGGLPVRSGDLLHGDAHGITSIPLEIAAQMPEACRRVETAERPLIDYARSPDATVEGLVRRYGEVD